MPDVFVIGGGPAGLAAAIAARLKGFDVTLADSALPTIDKACGEGLMPDSWAAFAKLGITPDPRHSFALRGVRFIGAGVTVESRFPQRSGIGIRRTELHRLLADRATDVGVKLEWGRRLASLDDIHAHWVIAADGQNSQARRWAQLDAARHESFRYGFRRHWRTAPWSDFIEIYWGERCQIYVTPVSPDEVNIALLCRDSHLRLDQALQEFPAVQSKLADAECTSTERGAVTPTRRLRRVYRGSTALIGDASGSEDAITGDGVMLSLQQAIALADAMSRGNLAEYQTKHEQFMRRPRLMSRLMLALDRSPWVRCRALRAMAAEPAIFANLVAMHVGSLSSADFFLRGMLPLGRQMLTVS